MRVILTGATGFIGAHVARIAVGEGHEVIALVRKGSDRWRIADVAGRMRIVEADLLDLEQLRRVVPEEADLCVHLAWAGWSAAGVSVEDNVGSLRMGLDLLRTLADRKCRRVVATGTCFEYDMNHSILSEQTPVRPHELYGACKASLYSVGQQFSQIARMSFAWARVFYSYGPYEDTRRLVPSVVRRLLRGELVETTGGEQFRDYMHVEDIAAAIWEVAKGKHEGAVNIASGSAVTVRRIVETIGSILGRPELLKIGALPYRKDEPMVIRSSVGLLRSLTAWRPANDLQHGLERTVEWWRSQDAESREHP